MLDTDQVLTKRLTIDEFLRQFDAYKNVNALGQNDPDDFKESSLTGSDNGGDEGVSLAQALAQ